MRSPMRPLLFHNCRLLDPATNLDVPGGLLVIDGRIVDVGPHLDASRASSGTELIDGEGYCLAPGLVDMRVQLGEPGSEHKERIATGVKAAAAGGITSLACLPNTNPPVDDPAMLEFVARRARQLRSVKVYPYGAITKGLEGNQLTEIGLLMESGAVAFADGPNAIADAQVFRRVLSYAANLGALIVQHPEEPSLARHGVMNEGEISTRLGLIGIPAIAEVMLVERDLRLVEATGTRYHVAHISTAAAIDAVRSAKSRGVTVSCETTPHHLALNELEVEGYRTFAKISPPLRTESDRRAVVEGLRDGTIDVIASDHTPQDQDSKRQPFAQAAFGVVGVETMLAVGLKLYHDGELSLLELLRKMTVAPARLLGIEAGRLVKGGPADLVLFDPDQPWKITEEGMVGLSKNTAFEGRLVQGRVLRTLVDGRTIYRH